MNGTAKEAVRCGVGWRTPRRAAWTKGRRPQDYPCPKQKKRAQQQCKPHSATGTGKDAGSTIVRP
ncbi:hypothetical protein I380019A4_08180 [Sutterella wadsworthensis]